MPPPSKAITEALNEQINAEIYSAYLYLSMSAFCQSQDYVGAAHWLRIQWEEELLHATKLIDHIGDRGGAVTLRSIGQPPTQFGSLLELFEQVLQHEQGVSASINRIYELSLAEKDYATQTLLQWFISEQVEEENAASEIVSMLKLAGKDGAGLLMVDQQLGQRIKTEPTPQEGGA